MAVPQVHRHRVPVMDRVTRVLHRAVPSQGFLAASGLFGAIVDGLTPLEVPQGGPRPDRRVRYGPGEKQVVELFDAGGPAGAAGARGTLVFVHGGAWGCGRPRYYRSIVPKLRDAGVAVALVGYETFPRAGMDAQASMVDAALAATLPLCGAAPVYLCGHSSGAHLVCLLLLRRALRGDPAPPRVEGAVLLNGVYCIASHFEYERARGVHELSPMARAAGGAANFPRVSPLHLARRRLTEAAAAALPPFCFVHGADDAAVPFTSSLAMHDALLARGAASSTAWLGRGHSGALADLCAAGPRPADAQLRRFMRCRL